MIQFEPHTDNNSQYNFRIDPQVYINGDHKLIARIKKSDGTVEEMEIEPHAEFILPYSITYLKLFDTPEYIQNMINHLQIRRSKIELANSFEELGDIMQQLSPKINSRYEFTWKTLTKPQNKS